MDNLRWTRNLFLLLLLLEGCVAPPTQQKKNVTQEKEMTLDDLGLEYNRYLKEVVDALESDKEFAEKLQSAREVDFRNGKVAAELEFVNHHVRTKLDELKRTELHRLKELVAQLDEREHPKKRDELHGHLDHSNPHTFEVADLHNLITKVRKDLDEADRLRKQDFKEYELQKEFEKQEKLKTLDEEHKKEYLHELEEQKKKHEQHERQIHHPGGKAQLEEVWENVDHMENVKFDPRAFFKMHDIDSNGYWDEQEVSALFLKELEKMYEAGHPEDDLREREEEMERMREHVFKETDTNRDRLISLEEFIEQTKRQEYQRDDGWETIDQKPQFTQEEYLEFEKRRQAEIADMQRRGLIPPYPDGYYQQGQVPPGQYGYPQYQHPNQIPQHPNQMPQHPNQMPQHPNQMPQHPNQIPQHPNQIPQHPNQVPQYPNQMPQHPNQMPQHPNQMPQHPNQVPQHPNQVPQHPNQVPQHPNQVPQHPNQVPQHPNQLPQHPNQVPQHTNQVPQQQNQVPQAVNQGYQPNQQNPPQQQFQQQNPPQPQFQQQNPPQQQFQQQNPPQQQYQPQNPPQQQNQQFQQQQQPQGNAAYQPHSNNIASNEKTANKA